MRREKRRELQIQIWRLLVLLLASAGFGWLLLRHGWTLNDQEQLLLRGDTGIKPELVARIGGLKFPQPLLEISPSDMETKLLNNLPVRAVSFQRVWRLIWSVSCRLHTRHDGGATPPKKERLTSEGIGSSPVPMHPIASPPVPSRSRVGRRINAL